MKYSDKYDVIRKTQIALFQSSGLCFDDNSLSPSEFEDLIHLFRPKCLADHLDLEYTEIEEIPNDGVNFEVAGVLNRTNRKIVVATKFPLVQTRLTGVHELVHWMIHKDIGCNEFHQDRPISYTPGKLSVPYYEWEATHFACRYLMPDKLVTNIFSRIYGFPHGHPFRISAQVAHYLHRDEGELRKMTIREKAFLLATTRKYHGSITPLHELFKVSPTAMAIRLEELKLIGQDRAKDRSHLRVVK